MAAMFVNGSEQYEQSYQKTFHRCFFSFVQAVSEEINFRNRPNRKINCQLFAKGSERNLYSLQRTLSQCFLPGGGSFYQAISEEMIYRNRPTRNKNCLLRPCLLTDQDLLSNLYRGPCIDASNQVAVPFSNRFKRRYLEIDQPEKNEMCNLYREHPQMLPTKFHFNRPSDFRGEDSNVKS